MSFSHILLAMDDFICLNEAIYLQNWLQSDSSRLQPSSAYGGETSHTGHKAESGQVPSESSRFLFLKYKASTNKQTFRLLLPGMVTAGVFIVELSLVYSVQIYPLNYNYVSLSISHILLVLDYCFLPP